MSLTGAHLRPRRRAVHLLAVGMAASALGLEWVSGRLCGALRTAGDRLGKWANR